MIRRMKWILAPILLLASVFAAQNAPQPMPLPPVAGNTLSLPSTVAADAKVIKLAQLMGDQTPFAEGTTSAANGDVYFTDQNNQRIYKWDVTQKMLSVFLEPSGRANGQYFDNKGNLLAAADERDQLWQITPDGKHTVIAAKFEEKYFNGPNDIWVRPDNGIYITDPYYRRTWWAEDPNHPPSQPQPERAVYFITPNRDAIRKVAVDFIMPNGIIGTPDGKTLYVSDIDARRTYSFNTQPDGALTNRKFVASYGSDGMTIDEQGHLYMTAGGANGVMVVDPKADGAALGFIPVPEHPANVAFGGKDHKTLFIAARTGFYSVETNVRGANPAK
jgi:gluconolactonase